VILECRKCGEEFDENDCGSRTEYEPTEAFGVRLAVQIDIPCCPFCGSTNVDELPSEADDDFDLAIDMPLRRTA
jgi:hypothetical protein